MKLDIKQFYETGNMDSNIWKHENRDNETKWMWLCNTYICYNFGFRRTLQELCNLNLNSWPDTGKRWCSDYVTVDKVDTTRNTNLYFTFCLCQYQAPHNPQWCFNEPLKPLYQWPFRINKLCADYSRTCVVNHGTQLARILSLKLAMNWREGWLIWTVLKQFVDSANT